MGDDPETAEGPAAPTDGSTLDTGDSGPVAASEDVVAGTIQVRPERPASSRGTGPLAPVLGPPTVVAARYELGTEIARGGMGRIVEATDTTLGRVVAVKEALATDAEALRRFARETKITARLEHPSIVPVHDAGVGPDGTPYYVMRKVAGRPLEQLVAGAANLNDRLALLPHVVAAAQAIAHAHERGIVHRDIKPSNILIGDLGEAIVIDWGLAKVLGESDEVPPRPGTPAPLDALDTLKTRAGVVFGTPGFMAPEQLRGKRVDPRFDVYALGATLYHLLSRRPPHHAKTAHEMMEAALTAPPRPIRELVTGVPPELSTIVDKALAHDPAARYQTARELAEDLRRFLTGQLVASHHYSPRERLVRFVKQHRVPVLVTAAATLALAGGGAIAVGRVVDERDRADAAAIAAREDKRLADERNDQLTINNAWMIASSNPTLAIAMLKPLARTPLWREVQPVAAAARAAGVAWSLPAPAQPLALEMTRDGTRALATGRDGAVWLYDLAQRTARTLADTGLPVRARFADDGRKVVVWEAARLAVLDTAGAGRHDLRVAAPIVELAVIGTTAWWVDEAGAVWQLELAGATPLRVLVDEPVHTLAPSPDGRWIALGGEHHLLLLDRAQPAAAPQQLVFGRTKHLDWATDGSRLAALIDEETVELVMDPAPTIIHRLTVGNRAFVVASGNRVYTVGPTGVGLVARDGSRMRRPLSGAVSLAEARAGTIIAATEKSIAVMSERGDHTLAIPSGKLVAAQASPASALVLGVADGRLLVWNLDAIQPREIATGVAMTRFAGRDHVVATGVDGPARMIDVRTRAEHDLRPLATLISVTYAAGSEAAVLEDVGHRAWLYVPGRPLVDLGTDHTDQLGLVSEHHVVLGANQPGRLLLHDVRTGARTPLIQRRHGLRELAWSRTSPPWIAAAFEDGTLWRKNLGSGAEAARIPRAPATSWLLVQRDGTVVFAAGTEIVAWRPDGTMAALAQLPEPVTQLGQAGPDHALAFTDAGGLYVLGLVPPYAVLDPQQTFRSRSTAAVSAAAATGMLVEATEGTLEIVDPFVKDRRWTLAGSPGITYADPELSSDGRWVLAKTATSLLVWSLDLPAHQADTIAWLDAMTNAVMADGRSFAWR